MEEPGKTKILGILGGTFDPVHLGHLHLAEEVWRQTGLDKIVLMPCSQSPLRVPPIANNAHRLAMLKLATAQNSHLSVEDFEVRNAGISYTVDTLQTLQKTDKYKNQVICLIMGVDAFAKFTSWHQWEKILELANIIVADRGEIAATLQNNIKVNELLQDRQIFNSAQLKSGKTGNILLINIQPLPISATLIRSLIKDNKDSEVKKLLPESVWKYILEHNLYR